MTSALYRGGCLCGAVRYEISGEPITFYHCHCGRCRKATGTGHASNLLVKSGTVNWIRGGNEVREYKVPEARRFANAFCPVCGGRVPRFVPQLEAVVIPAGSLDTDPAQAPQARIFWDSRAIWSCGGDGLPVFPEYPPR